MRHIPRGKHLAERLRRSSKEAAEDHVKCPQCGGWIDISDLGAFADHAGRCRIRR